MKLSSTGGMATDNQLRARVPDTHVEQIRTIAGDRQIAETEAERVVVREGLASLGYIEKPTDAGEMLLHYARKIGSLLGLVGLILIGYGIFGVPMARFVGFGLVLSGVAAMAGAEFAPVIKEKVVASEV